MAPFWTWTSKKASSPRPSSRLTSAGTVTRPAGFIETMLRTRAQAYPTYRQGVNEVKSQIDDLTMSQEQIYPHRAMSFIGRTTTDWEPAAEMTAAVACPRLYSRQGRLSSGRNPIERHRARSLLCGSNWNSHD